jgi:hypothetical protein
MTRTLTDTDQFSDIVKQIVATWHAENPDDVVVPRSVRRQLSLAVREDRRRQQREYQDVRASVQAAILGHQHDMEHGYRPRIEDDLEIWFTRQQQLARNRIEIERLVHDAPLLTQEDRGQAAAALAVAHNAPSVPIQVFYQTPPTGMHALRARVQDRLSSMRAWTAEHDWWRYEQWQRAFADPLRQAQHIGGVVAANAVRVATGVGLRIEDHLRAAGADARIAELERTVAALRADVDAARAGAETRPESGTASHRQTTDTSRLIGSAHPKGHGTQALGAAAPGAAFVGRVAEPPEVAAGLD